MSLIHTPSTPATNDRPLVIGLTGGIGSGKSTVADLFADLGIAIIDADRLAHELAAPGQPAYDMIVDAFGPQAVAPDGSLDRGFLRQRVFSNPHDKQMLEAILHPGIRKRMQSMLDSASGPYCIAVIPLLLETEQTDLIDRILVVDIPEHLQRQRVAERDNLSDNAIRDIMAAQVNRSIRLAAADDIISNETDRDALRRRVLDLHQQYLELAHA